MSAQVKGRAAWSPEAIAAYDAKIAARRAARIEDIEFLLQHEGNAQAIVKRAGFTTTLAAERYLDRAGRHDLSRRIRFLAEPCDPWEGSHINASERMHAA